MLEYHQPGKGASIVHAITWVNLRGVMPHERSWTEKAARQQTIPFIPKLPERKTTREKTDGLSAVA